MEAVLDRIPLRIKLVSAVLALVAAALLVISVASALALRSYLVAQLDEQLAGTMQRILHLSHPLVPGELPSSTYVMTIDGAHIGWQPSYGPGYSDASEPRVPNTLRSSLSLVDKYFFAPAEDHSRRWRVLIETRPNGELVM